MTSVATAPASAIRYSDDDGGRPEHRHRHRMQVDAGAAVHRRVEHDRGHHEGHGQREQREQLAAHRLHPEDHRPEPDTEQRRQRRPPPEASRGTAIRGWPPDTPRCTCRRRRRRRGRRRSSPSSRTGCSTTRPGSPSGRPGRGRIRRRPAGPATAGTRAARWRARPRSKLRLIAARLGAARLPADRQRALLRAAGPALMPGSFPAGTAAPR